MSYIEYITADQEFENPLEELARTNHFTLDDLAANRAGKISDAQWFRLLMRALEPVRYSGGALLGWLIACFVVKTLIPRIVLWIAALVGAKGIGVLFGAVTLACVGAFLMALFKSGRTMTLLIGDLKLGTAACYEGRVSPSKEDEGGLGMARVYGEKHTHYWYVAKNEYFEVDQEAHAALPPSMLFRLYYTPQSRLLLSIEPK